MRLVITFDDSLFPSLADFYPAEYGASVRGGSDLAAPGEGGVRHRVYVEPFNSAARIETRRSPEGVKQVSFFTQANPGAAVDSAIVWGNKIYRVIADSHDQTSGQGLLWRTEAVLVN